MGTAFSKSKSVTSTPAPDNCIDQCSYVPPSILDTAPGSIEAGTNTVGTNTVGTNTVGTNTVATNTVATNTVGTNTVLEDTVPLTPETTTVKILSKPQAVCGDDDLVQNKQELRDQPPLRAGRTSPADQV